MNNYNNEELKRIGVSIKNNENNWSILFQNSVVMDGLTEIDIKIFLTKTEREIISMLSTLPIKEKK